MAPPTGPLEEDRYLPTYEEIWNRAEVVQWMGLMGWPLRLIDSIMYEDSPSVDTVRSVVWRHGPNRALAIFLDILDGENGD